MAVTIGNDVGQGLSELQQTGSRIPNKIFVGGLAEQTKEEHIRKAFQEIDPTSPVQNVKIIVDRSIMTKSNEPRRYAFVEFNTENEVKKILDMITAQNKALDLHNRRLTVGQAYRKAPNQQNGYGLQNMGIIDPMAYYRLACAANAAAVTSFPKTMPVVSGMCYPFPMPMPYEMMSYNYPVPQPSSPSLMYNGNAYAGSIPSSPMNQVVPNVGVNMAGSSQRATNGFMYNQGMSTPNMMDGSYSPNCKTNGGMDDSGDMYMFQSPMQNGNCGDQRGRPNGRVMSMSHTVPVPQQANQMTARFVQQSPATSSPLDSRFLNGRPAYA